LSFSVLSIICATLTDCMLLCWIAAAIFVDASLSGSLAVHLVHFFVPFLLLLLLRSVVQIQIPSSSATVSFPQLRFSALTVLCRSSLIYLCTLLLLQIYAILAALMISFVIQKDWSLQNVDSFFYNKLCNNCILSHDNFSYLNIALLREKLGLGTTLPCDGVKDAFATYDRLAIFLSTTAIWHFRHFKPECANVTRNI